MKGGGEDVVRELGYLTLGTRLKRIGERLQAQTQEILDAEGFGIPAGQCPFLAAIDRSGPLTVGGLADAVGVTQPAATRSLSQLSTARLVAIKSASADQRRKEVRLTAKGRRLVERGKRVAWSRIEGAVRDLCDELNGPLLGQLAAIEDGLKERSLATRAAKVGPKRKRQ